jgi:hypothetical protein
MFQQFQQQKTWNCGDGHDQIWIDHFGHGIRIWLSGQKIVVQQIGKMSSYIIFSVHQIGK